MELGEVFHRDRLEAADRKGRRRQLRQSHPAPSWCILAGEAAGLPRSVKAVKQMEGGAAAVLPNEEVCELKPGWEEVAGATTENEEAKVSLTLNAGLGGSALGSSRDPRSRAQRLLPPLPVVLLPGWGRPPGGNPPR